MVDTRASRAKESVILEDISIEAPNSPSKGSGVSEDIVAEAYDTSPNKGSVASEALLAAESMDVLANDSVLAFSDSEWDYDEHPLTQLSLN